MSSFRTCPEELTCNFGFQFTNLVTFIRKEIKNFLLGHPTVDLHKLSGYNNITRSWNMWLKNIKRKTHVFTPASIKITVSVSDKISESCREEAKNQGSILVYCHFQHFNYCFLLYDVWSMRMHKILQKIFNNVMAHWNNEEMMLEKIIIISFISLF